MTTPTTTAPSSPIAPEPQTGTLAGEHAQLLRDVTRRADSVLALLAARTWPEAELRTLTAFLRTSVLRQASDEEVFLFPHGAAAPFVELTAEHARLYALIAQLDAADPASCPLADLRALVGQMSSALERHLVEEQAVLAALPEAPAVVPSAAELIAGTGAWLPPDGRPVLIMLDVLPEDRAVRLCVERLLRLRPGQRAEIHSGSEAELRRVAGWLRGFDSTRYGITWLHTGLSRPALQVSRRDGI